MTPRHGPVRPRAQSPPSSGGRSARRRRATEERNVPVSLTRPLSTEILELQRHSGNRAVAQLAQSEVYDSVQREAGKADGEDEKRWKEEFIQGRQLVEAGDFAGAEKIFRRQHDDPAVVARGGFLGTTLNLAICREKQGDFAEAITLYAEVLASKQDLPESKVAALERLQEALRASQVKIEAEGIINDTKDLSDSEKALVMRKRGITDLNRITDIIFWSRHPEMVGLKIKKGESDLANEWLAIREVAKPAKP